MPDRTSADHHHAAPGKPAAPAARPPSSYPPTAPPVSSPAGQMSDDAADALLLQFLCDRDAQCPRCRYNVRNLTRPVCPECHERLVLRVGVQELRVGKLIAVIIPGAFSGICGLFLLIPIIISFFPIAGGRPPAGIFALDAFGLFSGAVAAVIIIKRRAFLRLEDQTQLGAVITIWFVHLTAFLVLIVSLFI